MRGRWSWRGNEAGSRSRYLQGSIVWCFNGSRGGRPGWVGVRIGGYGFIRYGWSEDSETGMPRSKWGWWVAAGCVCRRASWRRSSSECFGLWKAEGDADAALVGEDLRGGGGGGS